MMNRELITSATSKVNIIMSESHFLDSDMVYFEFKDMTGGVTKLTLDLVSANGLRIAIGALQKVPRLVLPVNPKGEYICHFPEIKYSRGDLLFHKKDKESEPLGKYIDVDDGLIAFNREDMLWVGLSTRGAIVDKIAPKKYLVLKFPDKELLKSVKKSLDDKIFPFERFGKTNKLSYGYFHTIKEEV